MRGKKANVVSIVLFVMLTLSTCIATLLIFYFSELSIKSGLLSPVPVLNLYSEREILRTAVYEDFRQSVIEGYNEIAKEQSQVSGMPICEEFGGKKVFCSTDIGLKNNFETEVKKRFLESLKITDIKERLKGQGIDLSMSLDNMEMKLDSNFSLAIKNVTFIFTQEEGGTAEIIAKYNFDILQSISFNDIGLVNFEDIHKKILLCKPSTNFAECFKFDEFDLDIEDVTFGNREFYEVNMESKANFFVDGELKPIKVEFLIVK